MKRLCILLAALASCSSPPREHHEEREPEAVTFTKWSPAYEVFVDHAPFVVGKPSELAIHVTRLDKHAPVTGKVVATLRPASGAAVEVRDNEPAKPGVFKPSLTPPVAGACTLTVQIEDGPMKEEVSTTCIVHAAGAAIPAGEEEPPGRIRFPKEMAWSTEFGTGLVEERELVPTLRTTGEIRATAGREARLTATAHGRVVLESPVPILGTQVAAGQVLAKIVPQVENAADRVSLDADTKSARAELAAAEAQLARTERLWAARTIAEKQLEEAKTRVELARVKLNAAQGRLGQFDAGASGKGGGRTPFLVRSPIAGTLIAIHVSSGQSVEDGEPLFTVVDMSRIWLHADVFEPDIPEVENATRAAFRVDGSETPITIAPPDGRVVTIGQLVNEKTRTVPIIFELANPEQRVRIGSFATVWIETGAPIKAPAIPESAVVDDAGRKVAYVQVGGEAFERRLIKIGTRSGGWVEVESGLTKGERVVTKGAYELKLAASGGAVPEHGHAH